MKRIMCVFLVILIYKLSYSQVPTLQLDSTFCQPGDSVLVSLIGKNITNIGAITIRITIDTNTVKWGRIAYRNPQLEGVLAGRINHEVVIAWDGLEGVNLNDEVMVQLKFLYIGDSSRLKINPSLTELADLTGNVIPINFINGIILPITSVENNIQKPIDYSLSQNYPNPFNPNTTISYQIPKAGKVSLKVYDILGKEVAVLVEEYKEIGKYIVNFNGSNLASGIYMYKLEAGNFVSTKKLVLMK